ncbi:MAG: hypothetical protein WC593_03435 [Methanoregula sp.]
MKNIALAGIIVGTILLVLMVAVNLIMNIIIPVDISSYGGMRAMNDPIMLLFFFYPFVVAIAAAFVFDRVKDSLKGTPVEKGLIFGLLLIIIMTIPSLYVMYTSMTWPVAFYISTGIWEIVSFPVAGLIFARIWKL